MYKRDKLFMINIIGAAGVGKTTLADFLKNQLIDTAHVATDHIKRFISQFREVPSHNIVSRNVVNAMADEYLKNGISVIVEQGMDNEEIEKLKKIANQHSADFFLYRIEAHEDIRTQRVAERTTKTNKPMMSKETMDKLFNRYQKNTHSANQTFDSGKLSTEEMANLILEDLKVL
jgi:predicted kinase